MDVSPTHAGSITVDQVPLPRLPWIQALCLDQEVTLEAVPAFNYRFDYWSRDIRSIESYEVYDTHRLTTVDAKGIDHRLTAHFIKIIPDWGFAVIAAAVVGPLAFLRYRRRRLLG